MNSSLPNDIVDYYYDTSHYLYYNNFVEYVSYECQAFPELILAMIVLFYLSGTSIQYHRTGFKHCVCFVEKKRISLRDYLSTCLWLLHCW